MVNCWKIGVKLLSLLSFKGYLSLFCDVNYIKLKLYQHGNSCSQLR